MLHCIHGRSLVHVYAYIYRHTITCICHPNINASIQNDISRWKVLWVF